MSGSDRNSRSDPLHRLAALATLAVLLLVFAGTGAAAGINLDVVSPNNTYFGNLTVNISVNASSNVTDAMIFRNTTASPTTAPSDWTALDHATYTTENQSYFQLSNDTAQRLSDQEIVLNVTAWNGTHNSTVSQTVMLYNFTEPPHPDYTGPKPSGAPNAKMMEFNDSITTELDNVSNLSDVNFVMGVRMNGSLLSYTKEYFYNRSCAQTGLCTNRTFEEPWHGMQMNGILNATHVNLTNRTAAKQIRNFGQALNIQTRPPGTYAKDWGYNQIYVNETLFGAFNGDETITTITLYNLPFTSFKPAYLQTANGSATASTADYVNFTSFTPTGGGRGTLEFTVSHFSGYNASDTDDPTITANTLGNDTAWQEFDFNVTLNGTGTTINNDSIVLNVTNESDNTLLEYNYSDMTCATRSAEVLDCTLTEQLVDGTYNYTVYVEDYGGSAGNNATYIGDNVTIDTVAPNGTNDLNLSSANYTALKTWSPLVSRLLQDTAVGLDWSGASGGEIADADSGVDRLELWARNRSFNTSSHSLDAWGSWTKINGSIGTGVTILNESLSSGYQYRFNLSTVDLANNTNASNIINVTIDTEGPVFATNATGNGVYTRWVNASNTSSATASSAVSVNITDLAGINRSSIAGYVNGTHVADANLTITPSSSSQNATLYTVELAGTGLWNLTNLTSNTRLTVNASDALGNTNTSMQWNLSTDFNDPDTVEIKTDWDSADTGDGWYKDSVLVGVTKCTDAAGSGESGVDAVSAFVDGSLHAGWNASVNGTGAANLTLAENGNNTYVFKCRDVAGNINASQNASLLVDTRGANATFDLDPENNVGRNPTITLEFNDESDESGIDQSASTIYLYNQDSGANITEDLTVQNWNNNSVELDISDLSFDTDYIVNGTLADRAGHSGPFEDDFDTKTNSSSNDEEETTAASSGAGGTLVDSLAFVGLTDTLSLTPGGTQSVDVTLENDGDLNLESIDISVAVDDLDVSVSPDGFDLDSGDDEDVTIEVTAPADADTGVYAADVTAEADEGTTASKSFDIEVVVDGPAFTVTDRPDAIDVGRGNDTTVSITIKNTGSQDATGVQFSITDFNLSAGVTPTSTDLNADASTTVQLTVNETDVEVGVYPLTLVIAAGDAETTVTVDVKVQPASDVEKQEIEQEIEALKSRVAEVEAGNESDGELSSLVSEAETAIEQGDYARAAELQRQIEQQLPGGGGLPILLIVGILVFGLIAGGVIYLSTVSEESDGYGSYSSDLGPVRASQGAYSYHDRSLTDKVTDLLRNAWLYFDNNVLHHSRKASAKAQAHLDEFRQQAGQRMPRRGQRGRGGNRDLPRGGDFDERDGD